MLREFSAGGVVFKKEGDKVLWLITKSTPSKATPQSKWRLPKGRLDDEEDGNKSGPRARGEIKATEDEIRNAALKEVAEEGGVEARVIKKIGTERYFYTFEGKEYLKFVTFYLMEFVNDLPEGPNFETSEVVWLSYMEARKQLSYSGEKKILDKAQELLFH